MCSLGFVDFVLNSPMGSRAGVEIPDGLHQRNPKLQ